MVVRSITRPCDGDSGVGRQCGTVRDHRPLPGHQEDTDARRSRPCVASSDPAHGDRGGCSIRIWPTPLRQGLLHELNQAATGGSGRSGSTDLFLRHPMGPRPGHRVAQSRTGPAAAGPGLRAGRAGSVAGRTDRMRPGGRGLLRRRSPGRPGARRRLSSQGREPGSSAGIWPPPVWTDGSVDGVWCGDAFFFAPDLIQALGEVRRVLRPAVVW